MQSSRSSLPSQMDGAAVGLEDGKLSAAIGLPARPQGLGPRGGPPIPTAMPSCRPMAPGLRGSSGAQAQISVVKRWWGPQIPGPFILPMCSS